MAEDYSKFNGKKVVVVQNLPKPNEQGQSAIEVEGTVQAGNALGILIKPKGKSSFDMIEAADIEEVRLAEETQKPLKQKVLKPVEIGSARSHLLERHGWTLAQANALNEEQAFEQHNSIDHTELGHRHEDKSSTERAQAVSNAEENAA